MRPAFSPGTTAERIATLGGEPRGTPDYVSSHRSWDDYALGRAPTTEHLAALNVVYDGVIASHRHAQETLSEQDAVSKDLIIEQLRQLELFQWFVRAHLETSSGELISAGAKTEKEAAEQAAALE
ncbi:MAG: ferritin-like domain-containing protein [Acidimicrobiia bacterium]